MADGEEEEEVDGCKKEYKLVYENGSSSIVDYSSFTISANIDVYPVFIELKDVNITLFEDKRYL